MAICENQLIYRTVTHGALHRGKRVAHVKRTSYLQRVKDRRRRPFHVNAPKKRAPALARAGRRERTYEPRWKNPAGELAGEESAIRALLRPA